MLKTSSVDWIERAALGASAACLVHCLVLPLVIAAMPALTSALSLPESFHLWVLACAVPMALLALHQGHGRHGSVWPLLTGLAGLALMTAGALLWGETRAETPLTVVGSLLLAGAHVANWRMRYACPC